MMVVPPSTGPLLGRNASIPLPAVGESEKGFEPDSVASAPESSKVTLPCALPGVEHCTMLDDSHVTDDTVRAPPNKHILWTPAFAKCLPTRTAS